MIYILNQRAQHLLLWNIMRFPKLRNFPIIDDFLLTVGEMSDFAFEISASLKATEHRTDWSITIIASGLQAVYY